MRGGICWVALLVVGCERNAEMRAGERVDQEAAAAEAGKAFAGKAFAGLEVGLSGLEGDAGQVVCNLFPSEAAYRDGAATATAVVEAASDEAGGPVARFPLEEGGTYGVVCFHDENGDLRLDTNFLGMPSEGVGCSRDAKGGIGRGPRFGDMRFEYASGVLPVPVTLHYL